MNPLPPGASGVLEQRADTRRFFDRLAAGWSAHYGPGGSMADRTGRFLAAVRGTAPAGSRVLDFGCGSGEIARALRDAGFRVTAADSSPGMLATARRMGENIEWVALDERTLPRLPFADGAFAAAVCSSVLEYLPDVPGQLRELARVLAPGGTLHATVPDLRHPVRRRESLKRRAARFAPAYAVLRRTRWEAEYTYLRLSINWWPLEAWTAELGRAGLVAAAPGDCDHPLCLLEARPGRPVSRAVP